MKRFYILIFLSVSFLFGQLENAYPSLNLIKTYKIVDIRTEGEWRSTGILPKAYTITFFDERGNYNIEKFLRKLNSILSSPKEKFAVICRSGHRSKIVAQFLSRNGYNVINVLGGMNYAIRLGLPIEKYK